MASYSQKKREASRKSSDMKPDDITPPAPLDELDLRLVRLLEEDATQRNPALAAKVGVSSESVRRRLQRLLDERIIRFSLGVDPEDLGFETAEILGLRARPGNLDKVVRRLVGFPMVRSVMAVAGRYDLLMGVVFGHPRDTFRFIAEELGSIPEIASLERFPVGRTVKNSWHVFYEENVPEKQGVFRSIDGSEMILIQELVQNPRAHYVDIAARCGMNRTTIKRKLQSLQDDNIIRVTVATNLAAFGFVTQAAILVKVHPSHMSSVAESVSSHRNVRTVLTISGAFDLLLISAFHNTMELASFLHNDLRNITGIMHYEHLLQVKAFKRSFAVLS